jgi:hypothetical protein
MTSKRHFDADLPRVGADKLKPMARLWGNSSKLRKDECIELITQSLKDPKRLQAALASLNTTERNALALLKRMGGITEYRTLAVGLLASGITLAGASRHYYRNPATQLADDLLRRGLILGTGSYSPDYLETSLGQGGMIYSDDRLLAQVGLPEIKPLTLSPMPDPSHSVYRRPPTVALDIIGMVQAVDTLGGLKLTKAGGVHSHEQAKLRKALKWKESGMDLDGFIFPDPATAWIHALRSSDLLAVKDGRVIVQEPSECFAARPYAEQSRLLMEGFIRSNRWWEIPQSDYFDSHGAGRRQGRLALTLALTALPLQTGGFFSLDDFDRALYERIGEDFALDYPPQWPWGLYNETPEQKEKKLSNWRAKTRIDWLKQERPWLEKALTTWMYFLGLVELGLENNTLVGLRLTPLGKEVLHPEFAQAGQPSPGSSPTDQPGWVVQPNFDIIVYLGRTSAVQLAFLERHSERVEAHAHTAHYRLTRESVYRGLESGSTLDELLQTLAAGSNAPLPQNVEVEIREWAELRERLTLRRRTSLLEYSDPQGLQTALKNGAVGTVVGDRFLMVDALAENLSSGELIRIDYTQPLPKCLSVRENGQIHLKSGHHDLMIVSQLNQWAEPLPGNHWQLTADSVKVAIHSGLRLKQLLAWLDERLTHKLPALLELAFRSWGGESHFVELETVVVLRCPEESVFQAILSSPKIKILLKGYLEPNLLFVDPIQVEAFRAQLAWAGFSIVEYLRIIPLSRSI